MAAASSVIRTNVAGNSVGHDTGNELLAKYPDAMREVDIELGMLLQVRDST
jgi:hypothetical protein